MAEEQDKQFSRSAGRTSKAIDRITNKLEALKQTSETVGHGFDGFFNTSQKLQQTLSENENALEKIKKSQMGINEAQQLQNDLKDQANQFDEQAENLAKKLSDEKSKLNEEQIKNLEQLSKSAKESANQAKNLSKELQEATKTRMQDLKTEKRKEAFQSMFSGIGKTLKTMFSPLTKGFSFLAKKAKDTASATKSTLVPAGLFAKIAKFLFESFFKVNNEVTQIGRELSISANEARDIRQHFVNIANSSDNLRNTYTEIMKAQSVFQESLGTAAKTIDGGILDGMATLSNTIGLSDEAIVNFGRSALASGKSVAALTKEAARGSIETMKEFKVRAKFPKVLENIGKVTGQVRAQLGANFELMGKTVTKAQLLGKELSQVANESKNMLDFQSSIEAEMKAELFLGKQLNLEKARLAALTGDYDTYMDEIVKNAGSFYEFSKLNVLQQEALAAPLGMTADSLADMLLQREDLAALQQQAILDGEDEIANMAQQLSLQEKFTALMQKLQNIVVNLMAKLEALIMSDESSFLQFIGLTSDVFKDLTKTTTSTGDSAMSTGEFIDTTKGRVASTLAGDFTIRTHPQDRLIMAGGTQLGGDNNGMTIDQANELIRISKMNRVFSYDGFAAVKEARHYGTKFN